MSQTPPLATAPAPHDCAALADARRGVEETDRALAALLARRQAYVEAAARLGETAEAAGDDAAFEQAMAAMQNEAWEAGLSWAMAEPIWRTLLDRFRAHALEEIRRRGSGA